MFAYLDWDTINYAMLVGRRPTGRMRLTCVHKHQLVQLCSIGEKIFATKHVKDANDEGRDEEETKALLFQHRTDRPDKFNLP